MGERWPGLGGVHAARHACCCSLKACCSPGRQAPCRRAVGAAVQGKDPGGAARPKIPNPVCPLAWAYDTPGSLSSSRMARGMAYSTPPATSTAASNLQGMIEQCCRARQGEQPLDTGKGGAALLQVCAAPGPPPSPSAARLTWPGCPCSSACGRRALHLQGEGSEARHSEVSRLWWQGHAALAGTPVRRAHGLFVQCRW